MTEAQPRSRWLSWSLRWSWRDFRAHWVAVIAIAFVLAIGTGVYAGLGSTGEWRRQTNDASFAALEMHDLRLTLSPGTFIEQGELLGAIESIDDADSVSAAAERLVVDSQVDTGSLGLADSVLVPARLVGMTFGSDRPVDAVWIRDGTAPSADPADRSAVLEVKFADEHDLPTEGTILVSGGREVTYTGLGVTPEDFFYEGPEGTIFAAGELAIVYLPLAAVQDISGNEGMVNDAVITLVDGADRDSVAAQLDAAVSELGVGATVSTRDDADAVRVLYEDIDNDQRFWNALSALVLFAAALAAFNLINRIVEAQRREIGIGMALGVPRRQLAVRPMLIGVQVAVLGTFAGLAVGFLVGEAFGNLLKSFLPLPEHRTPFQYDIYLRAAVLGIAIPIVASAIPVWRALRVEPIEAIRTGHLAAKSSRLTGWTGKIPLPGSTMTQMPIRNVMRTPRRTALTAIGVGAAITSLVAVLGMLDSFGRTLDAGNDEFTKGDADRVVVQLDTFHPVRLAGRRRNRRRCRRRPDRRRSPSSRDGTRLRSGREPRPLDRVRRSRRSGVDADRRRARRRAAMTRPDILLARKAADDLGVQVGDTVVLRHPIRTDAGGFSIAETPLEVGGIHANPIRTFAFLDIADAQEFGLAGLVNVVQAYPADDATRSDVQRAVFGLDGVTSSQPVARISEAIDEALDQFVSFLFVTAGAVLVLALLIALQRDTHHRRGATDANTPPCEHSGSPPEPCSASSSRRASSSAPSPPSSDSSEASCSSGGCWTRWPRPHSPTWGSTSTSRRRRSSSRRSSASRPSPSHRSCSPDGCGG